MALNNCEAPVAGGADEVLDREAIISTSRRTSRSCPLPWLIIFTALLALGCAAMAGGKTKLRHQQWTTHTNTCTCTRDNKGTKDMLIDYVAVIIGCTYAQKAGFAALV